MAVPPGPPAATRLLIVGLHNSPHMHRWIGMIARPDTAIVLFPSFSYAAALPERFVPVSIADVDAAMPAGIWVVDPSEIHNEADRAADARAGYDPWTHSFVPRAALASPETLMRCIRRLDPDILHAMEMQLAGYLCAEASRRMGSDLPPWILSNWGSDVALFRKLPGHADRIAAVCRAVTLFLPDCDRDDALARAFGYRGPKLPAIPASGGMDVAALALDATVPPSRRRQIVIKGNHNWAGRGLLALSAALLARDALRGLRIGVVAAGPAHEAWLRQHDGTSGLDVALLPHLSDHAAAIARLAAARAVVGVGISDGCPTTMLEAMAVGALPIQSCTSCADEWIDHGVNGLIVSPHDTASMAAALARAARDDALVDRAASINRALVGERWDAARNGRRAWAIYDGMIAGATPRASGIAAQ